MKTQIQNVTGLSLESIFEMFNFCQFAQENGLTDFYRRKLVKELLDISLDLDPAKYGEDPEKFEAQKEKYSEKLSMLLMMDACSCCKMDIVDEEDTES